MKYKNSPTLFGIGVFALLLYQPVFAWELYRDPAYEAHMSQHNAQMQYYQDNINRILQGYEQQHSDELHARHQELQSQGIYIPYETFVQNHLMSNGGRNPQAVINQQRTFIGAVQGANQGLNQAYEGYLNSWKENQASKDRIHQNWGDATMGYSPYTNPYTGQTYSLPYGPWGYYGGTYTDGMNTFGQTPGGMIYQEDPSGFRTPMEESRKNGFWQNFFGD